MHTTLVLTVFTGLPVVLKFTIVLKSAIVLKFYSFGQNVLIRTFVMLSLHFFYKWWLRLCCWRWVSSNVSLETLYCSMCNIALVTFLGLQYWSTSMINIYEHKNVHFLCLEPCETDKCPEIVLKFSKKFGPEISLPAAGSPGSCCTLKLCCSLCLDIC